MDGKSKEERKLQFEILEIGAVKLDENLNKIAEFSEMVKPQVYKQLNWHTQKMLKITWGGLKKGHPFPEVFRHFYKWCGDDAVFCTWGTQDLTELQRNMAYFNMEPLSEAPIRFLNVQKIFATYKGDSQKVYNLESAVDEAGIDKDIPFHRAFADAYYTSKIMAIVGKKFFDIGMTYDLYHIPSDKESEIKEYKNKTFYYVSCGYEEREDITGNRRLLSMTCAKCNHRNLRPKIRWFSTNSKLYYGAAVCVIHGPIKGRLKVKNSENGLYYVEKTLTYTTNTEIEELKSYRMTKKKKKKPENPEKTEKTEKSEKIQKTDKAKKTEGNSDETRDNQH